jgi:hypothetical protein
MFENKVTINVLRICVVRAKYKTGWIYILIVSKVNVWVVRNLWEALRTILETINLIIIAIAIEKCKKKGRRTIPLLKARR